MIITEDLGIRLVVVQYSLVSYIISVRTLGNIVVKALRYKPERCGFDTR
jgi:hypothetical protein